MIFLVIQDNLVVWVAFGMADAKAHADSLATLNHPCTIVQTYAWIPYVKTV